MIIFNSIHFLPTLISKFVPYFCQLSGKSDRVDQWSKLVVQLNAQIFKTGIYYTHILLKSFKYLCRTLHTTKILETYKSRNSKGQNIMNIACSFKFVSGSKYS